MFIGKGTRVVWVLLCTLSLLYIDRVCVLLGAQHLILLMPSDRKLSYILLNCW
jgi:hypothetical protein